MLVDLGAHRDGKRRVEKHRWQPSKEDLDLVALIAVQFCLVAISACNLILMVSVLRRLRASRDRHRT